MTKDEIILAQKEFLFPAVFNYYKQPLVISHAKDQYVWDADGISISISSAASSLSAWVTVTNR